VGRGRKRRIYGWLILSGCEARNDQRRQENN
jgi:hypothetical protein